MPIWIRCIGLRISITSETLECLGRQSRAGRGFEQRAPFVAKFAPPHATEGGGEMLRGNRRQKAQAADIDAEEWRGRTSGRAGDMQQGAIAAEDQHQVHLACERRGVPIQPGAQPRMPASGFIRRDLAARGNL